MRYSILVSSFTGNTRRVAGVLAEGLGASLSDLRAPMIVNGFWGILHGGYSTLFGTSTKVTVEGPDPTLSDCLILAAPVWAGRLSVPMRSWLTPRPMLPPRVALVMTGGAPKPADTAFADFARRAGVTPVATLYLSEAEVRAGRLDAACAPFCAALRGLA